MTYEEQQFMHNVQCAFTLLDHEAELTTEALNVDKEFLMEVADSVQETFNTCEGKRSLFYERMIIQHKPKTLYELFMLGMVCGDAERQARSEIDTRMQKLRDLLDKGMSGLSGLDLD